MPSPLLLGLGAAWGCFWLIQLLYYLVIYGRFAWASPRPPAGPPEPPLGVSVVVAARNELANLQTLLPQLLAQNYPTFEVVVVNDRSWDDTWPYLYQLRQTEPRLRTVLVNEAPDDFSGKKYALTLGIKAAKYPLVLLTDADCQPASPRWIAAMADSFRPGRELVLGYSPYRAAPGALNWFIRWETLFTALQYFAWATWGRPYMGVGRNLAYRRELFFAHNGFAGHMKVLGGDDDLFVNQAATAKNTTVCYGPESLVFSHPKTTWRAWYVQKKRHLAVGKRYKWGHKLWLGLYTLTHAGTWAGGAVFLAYAAWLRHPVAAGLAVGAWLVRWAVQAAILTGAKKKLADGPNLVFLPLFDLLYLIYQLIIGLAATTSRRIKWN
ncbi:MAG: glycosyltransferase [Bernardetiaceae bacterium]|nr:glycosyltransferase [Bernardetiaceae bacterium]